MGNLRHPCYYLRIGDRGCGYFLDIDSYATVFPTDASGATYVPTIVKPSGFRPGSPVNIRLEASQDGVRVHWQPPPNSSVPVMYYMVEYRKQGEQWGRSSDPIADGRTYFLAKDIQPGAPYEFRVYAFTLTSFSEPSEIQRFTLTCKGLGCSNTEQDRYQVVLLQMNLRETSARLLRLQQELWEEFCSSLYQSL